MTPQAWALWTAALSGFFGLLTAAVVLWMGQRYDRDKRKEENERWRLDREAEERRWRLDREAKERQWLLERRHAKRFDAIAALHAALIDCHYELNGRLNYPPTTETEFREFVQGKLDAYLRALVMAAIYLTPAEQEIMQKRLGSFRTAVHAIFLRMPAEAFNPPRSFGRTEPASDPWDGFFETQEAATNCLRSLLDPHASSTSPADTDTSTDT